MVKNRLKIKFSQDDDVRALLNEYETKTWALWYKERNIFEYLDHEQLKTLIGEDRIKFVGKYELVDFGLGNKRKVWVDFMVILTDEEKRVFGDLIPKPKDYDEKGGWNG